MGASPPNPPGFMALRATTHSARRSLWIALLWQFVQFNICSIVPVILFRCICPVGIWSIKYLFRYPLAQLTFCSIDFCSTDFLFNWFLFNWHFVQLFCSIVLVQFGLGESTCHHARYLINKLDWKERKEGRERRDRRIRGWMYYRSNWQREKRERKSNPFLSLLVGHVAKIPFFVSPSFSDDNGAIRSKITFEQFNLAIKFKSHFSRHIPRPSFHGNAGRL